MIIREATREDWPAISDISERSGYNDYINRLGPSYMETGKILIAEEEQPLGFSKIEILPDNSSWLSGLRVDPNHWRKGVGKALTQKGMDISRSNGTYAARVIVEDTNSKSRSLTEKLGFHEAESYRFFRGGLNLDGYEEADLDVPGYLSLGWRFIRPERSENIPGTFLKKGENKVFVNEQRTSFHVISASEPLEPSGEGFTLCLERIGGDAFSNLVVMDDFPVGILYEILF